MAYTENDCFCAVTDVEELVGRGAFSTLTRPTAVQVIDFMAKQAARIQAAMWTAGHRYTVPSGGTPLPNTTDTDKMVKALANAANAYLAAGDAAQAHQVRDTGEVAEDAIAWWNQGRDYLDRLIALVGSSTVHSDGGTSVRSSTGTGGIAKSDFNEVGHNEERKRSEGWTLDTKA